MKIACQFVNPKTGLRSKAFDGTWQEILGALTKLREMHQEENPGEEIPFDDHLVLILYEQPDDDQGFFSQRPMLSVPNFEDAVQSVITKTIEPVNLEEASAVS